LTAWVRVGCEGQYSTTGGPLAGRTGRRTASGWAQVARGLAVQWNTRMSRNSTITRRGTPVPPAASASAGGLEIHAESFVIDTDERVELVDLTDRVMEFVRQSEVAE